MSAAASPPVGPVIVTGAASGLGAAVAKALLATGTVVGALDRRPPAIAMEHEVVDLAVTPDAEEAVRDLAGRLGGLGAIVTCAGTDRCGGLDEVSRTDWEHVVAVNLLGTAAVVRAALPFLASSRGRVVTVASTLGLRALPEATAYCASKFGVVGFTRALAAETAGRIGVTLIVPGGMQTAFFDGREPRFRPPQKAELTQPEDVASVVVFALRQPRGCELRELVVTPSRESSWP